MNATLLRPFTVEEISAAFLDINPKKAPGIDGFPSSFYRQHWDMIGPDFLSLCMDLLQGKADMASVNRSVIVLIPKIYDPTTMKHFRPISLCTVIYKTVFKVLVNRLKSTLSSCISDSQAAFISGRNITDNILIAHELVHTFHSSGTLSSQGAAVKLDMEKAFDRVEWSFLRDVMLRMGFAREWVNLILRCVSSVSFSVRVNGTLFEEFFPTRGIRQGDPLSPFLFLFCSQGLSAALETEQREGRLSGLSASRHGPRVTHQLFADDSMVFIRNEPQEVARLRYVLSQYASSSGQTVNFDKSTAYCSQRCSSDFLRSMRSTLGVRLVDDLGIYLGVPLLIKRNRTASLGFVRDKVQSRMSKWDSSFLSYSGREILIKSVAQAMPQYVMSCYLLPQNIIDDITMSIRRYWWFGRSNKRGWPLLSWDSLCTPKNVGGLGFRDLHTFNIALLGKQIWHLLSHPDSLLARVLRAKYYPSGDLLNASADKRASFAWKGINQAIHSLGPGYFWRPGVKSSIRLLRDT
ncbi:hypothetical protein HRI_001406700 [Hibiscus trionum]|uniref:Reverse transcriptase domain-containing protein n=1 Tax=Hibiscus trionum TaxID=183268 RepID=A0A9W7LU57_HIBTR|nr:hypothetical protein HRI_001406700 [Hibiscus trionum]